MTAFENTRRLLALATLAGTALMAGCASLNAVRSTVATYGTWPDGQAPGTYAFDRLPSQEKNPQRQQALENAAAQALDTAGFKPAAAGATPGVTVQIGARIERFETSPWDDPFWFAGYHRGWGRGGFGGPWMAPYGPYGLGGPYGPYWRPWGPTPDQYLREVALLIRDTASGKPLYEARANSDGYTAGGDRLLAAMFDAAMKDFPRSNDKAHDITVPLPVVPSVAPAAAAAASGAAS